MEAVCSGPYALRSPCDHHDDVNVGLERIAVSFQDVDDAGGDADDVRDADDGRDADDEYDDDDDDDALRMSMMRMMMNRMWVRMVTTMKSSISMG